jgi:hypothetical protein
MKKVVCNALVLCLVMWLSAFCQAQRVHLMLKTLKCDEGESFHPVHVSVSVFDADKVPNIVKLANDLSNENDPNNFERALKLYGELQKRVRETPALGRIKSLPTPEYLIDLHPVRRIIVVAFDGREFDPISYAVQQLDVASGQLNRAILNFSSGNECKEAK